MQLAFSAVNGASLAQDDLPDIKGPYFGRETPGLTPEEFAPGVILTEHRNHIDLWISFKQQDGSRGEAIKTGRVMVISDA